MNYTNKMQNACTSKIQEELTEHPELADLDGASGNGGSSAPTTNAGTPRQSSAAPSKLKITFNNSQLNTKDNGGSSAAQSDDDDDDED